VSVRILQGDCLDVLKILADESVLAYCAGVIDSDGTIGIKRNSYAARIIKDCTQATYSARICVRQVQPEGVRCLQGAFGGSIRKNKGTGRGRDLFSWEIRDKLAESALRKLLPYLRIKRAQAENCLALREVIAQSKSVRVAFGRGHEGAAQRPTGLTEEMERLTARAHELNKVGVPA
jgi:hypothetical protein